MLILFLYKMSLGGIETSDVIAAEMFAIGGERKWVGTLHIFAVPLFGEHLLKSMSFSRIRDIHVTVITQNVVNMDIGSIVNISEMSRSDDERLVGFGDNGYIANMYEAGGRGIWIGTLKLSAVPPPGHYRLAPLFIGNMYQIPVTCYPSCSLW